MKIIVSVGGRFHAFYLAVQLHKRNYLERLITSYPKFEAVKYGIPKGKIKSILIKEMLERGWGKLPDFIKRNFNPQLLISDLYDRLASRKIIPADIFIGWSSQSLYSLRKAKKMGAQIIIERGSSHILYQNKILKEEYEKFGLKPQLPHPKIIDKELKEYEEADYIEVPSFFVKRTFLEQGFSENKIIQGGRGIDLGHFKKIPKDDDIFRVVFVGGMTLRKGVHYLLQAFSELDLPNSELVLIGSWNEEIKPFFKKYKGKFNWLGHIPQKKLYKYYSQGTVFAIMSIEEGLAAVQFQAMACGLPVICTPNTGGEDIVRDNKDGFIIPIRDIESLKEKLVYLYKNPDICRQMGESAIKRVSEGFTWDDYGDKIIRVYENILKK